MFFENHFLTIILVYLAVINLAGFFIMWSDKRKARAHQWRIPEKRFFLTALAGGSLGVFLGMWTFRHKTKHWYFVIGIPGILMLQAALLLWGFLKLSYL